jgi:hypothetical protein
VNGLDGRSMQATRINRPLERSRGWLRSVDSDDDPASGRFGVGHVLSHDRDRASCVLEALLAHGAE